MIYQSAIELSHFWLPFIGFVVGLLATMIGGNGAFFFPPILILFFQVSPRVAIATSLAAVIPMGLIGSAEHYRRGNVNLTVGLTFGAAGLVGAFLGAWVSGLMDPSMLVKTFGGYTILLALLTLRTPLCRPEDEINPPTGLSGLNRRTGTMIVLFGLLSGAVAGLFGTSGSAPVLAGLFILQFPVRLVIGTSVLIVFINALSGFSGHLLMGEIDPELILRLGSGAAVGAFLGPRLLVRMRPERRQGSIRYVFVAVLLALGVTLLLR